MRWIGYVATILWWSGIARSLSTLNRGHNALSTDIGYKITPKPCRVPGPESKEGTCMFVWECIKSEGTHVGVCVDTFMFGSCCVHNSTTNSITRPHNHHPHGPTSSSLSSSSAADALRPTLAEALGNESTRPTLTSLTSSLVANSSTTSPGHHPTETFQSSGGFGKPHKPPLASSSRPLQKRPHAKPAPDPKDRVQTSAVPVPSNFWDKDSQSTKRPTDSWDKAPQNGKRPGLSSDVLEKGPQNTRRPGSSSESWDKSPHSTRRPGSSSESLDKGPQSTKRPGSPLDNLDKSSQSTRRPVSSSESWDKSPHSTRRPGSSSESLDKVSQSTRRPGSPLDNLDKSSQSTRRPVSSSESWDKGTQSTRRPGSSSESLNRGPQGTRRPGSSSESLDKGHQSTKRPGSLSESFEKGSHSTRRPGSSSDSWDKGSQSTRRPGMPLDNWDKVTQSSKKPGSSFESLDKGSQSNKRPNSSFDSLDKGSQSTRKPGSPFETWDKGSQITRRPASSSESITKEPQSTKLPSTLSNHPENGSQSTRTPGLPDLWEKGSQNAKTPGSQSTKRPSSNVLQENTKQPSYHQVQNLQKTRPGSNQHTGGKETETTHSGGFQGPYLGFKDKIDTEHNTLVVRLPGKEHVSSEDKQIRPSRPNNQRPSESRPDDSKTEDGDLNVQESVHRPSVNLVDENETAKDPHPSLNFIHTERPQWATKPVSPKPTTDSSKPYFSIKPTTTYRPVSVNNQQDARPNFVSKPNGSSTTTKTSMIVRPTHFGGQSTTSAAGSLPQTSHWQVTTEPAFVTKHRPSSSTRPVGSPETVKPLASSSHFWSENSWTPPRPSLKPHWTDNPSLLQNGPEAFPPRPSFKPTEPQESTGFHKPLGSAHYITTSHFETSARPRPTKKTTTSTTSTTSTTTSTTTTTTTSTTTTTTTTTPKPDTTASTSEATPKTGSVLTVSAAAESKGTQCGVPPLFPQPETRIVGGKDAPFGRWPWQVSVRRTSFFGFSSTHRCGGAVLNENWIATAGHCVDDLLTSQIRIRVGEYDFSSVQERLPYVERGVAKKVVHPKYNFFTYEYDLALVRLESSLTFAPHISPICLPATDDLLIGENATVTGWGRLSEGGTLPSVLQEVSVPIVSNDRCKSMFLRAGRHEFIPDIFLCAGYESGGQDSCQGDSGGPLQVRGKDGRYFLAGIISWGIGCAEANLPGVCTRISKFVPWILKNVT